MASPRIHGNRGQSAAPETMSDMAQSRRNGRRQLVDAKLPGSNDRLGAASNRTGLTNLKVCKRAAAAAAAATAVQFSAGNARLSTFIRFKYIRSRTLVIFPGEAGTIFPFVGRIHPLLYFSLPFPSSPIPLPILLGTLLPFPSFSFKSNRNILMKQKTSQDMKGQMTANT